MQMFVNGLKINTKQLIDTADGGSTNFSIATSIKKIIKTIAENEHLELYDWSVSKPGGRIALRLPAQNIKMEDQVVAEVEKILKAMNIGTQQATQVQPVQAVSCEICGGPHYAMHCVAIVQQMKKLVY